MQLRTKETGFANVLPKKKHARQIPLIHVSKIKGFVAAGAQENLVVKHFKFASRVNAVNLS